MLKSKAKRRSAGAERPARPTIANEPLTITSEQILQNLNAQLKDQIQGSPTGSATLLQSPTRQPKFAIIRLSPASTSNQTPTITTTTTTTTATTTTPAKPTIATTTTTVTTTPTTTTTTPPTATTATTTIAVINTTTTKDNSEPTTTTDTSNKPVDDPQSGAGCSSCVSTPSVSQHTGAVVTTPVRKQCTNFSETERVYILLALTAARERLRIHPENDKIGIDLCEQTRNILSEPRYRGRVKVHGLCQPSDHTIRSIWTVFHNEGRIGRNTENIGRKRDLAARDKIVELIRSKPKGKFSIRSIARETGSSTGTVARVVDEMKKEERKKKKRVKPVAKSVDNESSELQLD